MNIRGIITTMSPTMRDSLAAVARGESISRQQVMALESRGLILNDPILDGPKLTFTGADVHKTIQKENQ